MILTCPSCETRYRVGEGELQDGRRLRCAHCGREWRYEAPARLSPRLEAPPQRPPLAAEERAPFAPSRQRAWAGSARRAAALFLFLVLLLAAALALSFGRRVVEALWPSSARLYALLSAPPEPLGAGLEIAGITPKRTAEGLIIKGEIRNTSEVERKVPALKIALRNEQKKEIQSKIVDPPKARLLPGQSERFATPFAHPSRGATGVVVTFAHG